MHDHSRLSFIRDADGVSYSENPHRSWNVTLWGKGFSCWFPWIASLTWIIWYFSNGFFLLGKTCCFPSCFAQCLCIPRPELWLKDAACLPCGNSCVKVKAEAEGSSTFITCIGFHSSVFSWWVRSEHQLRAFHTDDIRIVSLQCEFTHAV